MKVNRLEKVTKEGVYIAHMTKDSCANYQIGKERFRIDWPVVPNNANKRLKAKIINELIETCHSYRNKNGSAPLLITATATEEVDLVYSIVPPIKFKLSRSQLRSFEDKEDLYTATFFRDPNGRISIAGERYGTSWSHIPLSANDSFVAKIYTEAIEAGHQFFRDQGNLPSRVTINGLERIGLVYTLAE